MVAAHPPKSASPGLSPGAAPTRTSACERRILSGYPPPAHRDPFALHPMRCLKSFLPLGANRMHQPGRGPVSFGTSWCGNHPGPGTHSLPCGVSEAQRRRATPFEIDSSTYLHQLLLFVKPFLSVSFHVLLLIPRCICILIALHLPKSLVLDGYDQHFRDAFLLHPPPFLPRLRGQQRLTRRPSTKNKCLSRGCVVASSNTTSCRPSEIVQADLGGCCCLWVDWRQFRAACGVFKWLELYS
jgi:hypothetical protein